MLGQKNKTHIIVGKDLAPLAETETRADLVAGKIGVFKNGSSTAIDGTTDLTTGDKFKVVYMNVDGKIIESPMYDYDLLKRKKAKNYAVDTEQKVYVGYNGTTGSITVANSSVYHIHITRWNGSKTWGEHGLYKLAGAYESDASATEAEIADGLAASLAKNFDEEKTRSGVQVTKVGLINSAALATGEDFDGTTTVVNGLNAIVVTSSGTYNTGSVVAVGDYVRLGASATTAVTLKSNVYKVTAISGTTTKTFTLDRKVIEPSGSYVTGSDYTQVVPSATAKAADYGLMFVSNSNPKFDPGLFMNQKIEFELGLSDAFGSTLVTQDTAATKGSGTYREVAQMEWNLRSNRGPGYKVASYPVNQNLNAISGKTYDMISLDFENDNARTLDGKATSFHSLVIATENESTSTIHTDLKDILNIS